MEEKSELIEQHSVLKSVLLHLVPGIPILLGIFLFSLPVFTTSLGIATELRSLVGLILSAIFMLIVIQLIILFYEGRKLNNKISLKGVIGYTEKSSIKEYAIFIPVLIAFNIIMFVIIAPPVNNFMVETLFWWYPQEYNFQNLVVDPTLLAGYQSVQFALILYIIVAAILAPIVEELYFRGYLFPRMASYAKKWAPLVSTVLFSVYHFFSPWENPIRIIGTLPVYYVVWKKKDIRFGIIVHVLLNTFGGIMMLISVL
ncbi:MAG: CPBP family intramembrane metalloprotease [Candidatus Lokiarchaeota archaeon]|nr:CPBP family intramembrane metalloprotease [Candidatus Lokiarchaeota archaeon]